MSTTTPNDLSRKSLDILQGEHEFQTWIGPKLLAVANDFRSFGGSFEDYDVSVRLSNLWSSYEGATSDTWTERERNLERAWDRSFQYRPFELHESLDELRHTVMAADWVGRGGSRDLAVLVAFIDFCQDHNCFTRTISSYELAKWTAGFSPSTVQRALTSLLVRDSPLQHADRTDRAPTRRSTRRYTINLDWRPFAGLSRHDAVCVVRDSMSPPGRLIASGTSLSTSDAFSNNGLGPTAGRAYTMIGDEWVTRKRVAAAAGMTLGMARRALSRLYDAGLVAKRGQRPIEYRRAVDGDPEVVAEMMGVAGTIDRNIEKIILRQEQNMGYRSTISK